MQARQELRTKVEKRQQELKSALKGAEQKHLPEGHTLALNNELQACEDAISGGWDKMAEVTAAQLTRWLDQTATLVSGEVKPSAEKASLTDKARLSDVIKAPDSEQDPLQRGIERS